MVEEPRLDSGSSNGLDQGIQIPDHSAIVLAIEGVRNFPHPCHIKILAVRKFNENTLDFHCRVNAESTLRFLLKINEAGLCQIDQIVDQANRSITLREVDTTSAVNAMINVLPPKVKQAVDRKSVV